MPLVLSYSVHSVGWSDAWRGFAFLRALATVSGRVGRPLSSLVVGTISILGPERFDLKNRSTLLELSRQQSPDGVCVKPAAGQ
jgi:hypothetical protein